MAVGIGNSLSTLERSWFAQRVAGAVGTTPLNDIKRQYYVAQLGAVPSVNPLDDLEKRWLRKIIADNGATPSGNELSSLWTQVVSSVVGLRVSKYMDENKQTYFRNVA